MAAGRRTRGSRADGLRDAGREAIALDPPADDPDARLTSYVEPAVTTARDQQDTVVVAQSIGAVTTPGFVALQHSHRDGARVSKLDQGHSAAGSEEPVRVAVKRDSPAIPIAQAPFAWLECVPRAGFVRRPQALGTLGARQQLSRARPMGAAQRPLAPTRRSRQGLSY
jgi:hypothetical protein